MFAIGLRFLPLVKIWSLYLFFYSILFHSFHRHPNLNLWQSSFILRFWWRQVRMEHFRNNCSTIKSAFFASSFLSLQSSSKEWKSLFFTPCLLTSTTFFGGFFHISIPSTYNVRQTAWNLYGEEEGDGKWKEIEGANWEYNETNVQTFKLNLDTNVNWIKGSRLGRKPKGIWMGRNLRREDRRRTRIQVDR